MARKLLKNIFNNFGGYPLGCVIPPFLSQTISASNSFAHFSVLSDLNKLIPFQQGYRRNLKIQFFRKYVLGFLKF